MVTVSLCVNYEHFPELQRLLYFFLILTPLVQLQLHVLWLTASAISRLRERACYQCMFYRSLRLLSDLLEVL